MLDDLQKGRIRILTNVVTDEQGLAARDYPSTEPFSLLDTGAGYCCASLPGLRPDNEFIALILAQGQHAGVGFEKSARTLDDQIQCWFKADLGTDFLPNLVERGRLRNFSLQRSLVPLERGGHVIERLRQPSNLVLRSDVDDNVAPAGGDLVCSAGETTDGTRQSSHTIHGEQQRAC